jgi:AbrB family looped-hinge helix DNA binding protein
MTATVKTKIGPGGRVVIPAEFRERLGLSVGDAVVLSIEDGEVRLMSFRERIKRMQEFVAARIDPNGPSIVDELIRQRREEAARE